MGEWSLTTRDRSRWINALLVDSCDMETSHRELVAIAAVMTTCHDLSLPPLWATLLILGSLLKYASYKQIFILGLSFKGNDNITHPYFYGGQDRWKFWGDLQRGIQPDYSQSQETVTLPLSVFGDLGKVRFSGSQCYAKMRSTKYLLWSILVKESGQNRVEEREMWYGNRSLRKYLLT